MIRVRNLQPGGGRHGFRRIQRAASGLYESWCSLELPPELLQPLWVEARPAFAAFVAEGVPYDFLQIPIVRHMLYRTGFGDLEQAELRYIENAPPALRSLCAGYRESPVGAPVADCDALRLSVASLNKLYYFARIANHLPTPRRVVELGGGYGHMSHVLHTLLSPPPTCVVLDLPELLTLQYTFLEASGIGTHPHLEPPTRLREGKVNLVPVQFLDDVGPACDLFISTFSLSETPAGLQTRVAATRFFGAGSIYLTGQLTDAPLWSPYVLDDMTAVRKAALLGFRWASIAHLPAVSAWELIAGGPSGRRDADRPPP